MENKPKRLGFLSAIAGIIAGETLLQPAAVIPTFNSPLYLPQPKSGNRKKHKRKDTAWRKRHGR